MKLSQNQSYLIRDAYAAQHAAKVQALSEGKALAFRSAAQHAAKVQALSEGKALAFRSIQIYEVKFRPWLEYQREIRERQKAASRMAVLLCQRSLNARSRAVRVARAFVRHSADSAPPEMEDELSRLLFQIPPKTLASPPPLIPVSFPPVNWGGKAYS